jgi:two-component system OmpR family sensor kinase
MSGARRDGRRRRLRTRVSRLPLRVRLVAGFVVAVTVVLAGAGAFVYWRVQFALDRGLDTELAQEAAALRPLVTSEGALTVEPGDAGPLGVAEHQVLDDRGRVLSAGPALGDRRLLSGPSVQAALRETIHRDVGDLVPISRQPLRVRAEPLRGDGPAAVLVVAVRRDQRDEALRELVGQLLVAGLGTLVVTAVVGERLAKAALAPVERYRARAQSVAAGATRVRLDVPPGRDDEITRLGHTLNDMLAALERSLDRERRFLDDASHELRTPLTLLLTRVQLARRRPRSVAEHEEVLAELETDVAALAALAEELLQLGAALQDTGAGAQLVPAPGDVARVVASIVPPSAGEHADRGLLPATWTVESVAPGTTAVSMPDGPLRQVLLNLLSNASVHGAPPVGVAVRRAPTAAGDVVVLTVTDSGDGVPAQFLPTAVGRFARMDTARDRPGAGLGLSLVHAVVRRYGGELRLCSQGAHHRYDTVHDVVCSHPAEGTTASVLLALTDTQTATTPPINGSAAAG